MSEQEKLTTPRETRSWWRTFIRITLVVFALLLAARMIWGVMTAKELDQAVQAVQKYGEPLTLAELPHPTVSPADDAWPIYRQLLDKVAATGIGAAPLLAHKADTGTLSEAEQAQLTQDKADDELLDAWWKNLGARAEKAPQVQARVEAGAELLALLRQASAKPQAGWPVVEDPFSPAINEAMLLYRVVQLAGADAILQFDAGRPQAALDDVAALLQLSNHLSSMHGIVGRQWEIITAQYACEALQEMLPRLDLSAEQAGRLRALLQGGTGTAALRPTAIHNRAMYQTIYLKLISNQMTIDAAPDGKNDIGWSGRLKNWIYRPFVDASQAYNLQQYAKFLPLLDQPYVQAAGKLDEIEKAAIEAGSSISGFTRQWGVANTFYVVATARMTAMSRATRDMASVALAVRLYQLQQGKLPARLEELVPTYLPALPADALCGAPLGYISQGPAPRLYSTGLDRADNGGSYQMTEDPQGLKGHDVCFFLTGVPADARPQPATTSAPTTSSAPSTAPTTTSQERTN